MSYHPIQNDRTRREVPEEVALAAYEVYVELYGEQKALITGNCRGGFSVDELIGFLYAKSFPRKEWKDKFESSLKRREE